MATWMENWTAGIEFEREGPLRRLLKAAMVNPAANFLPAAMIKALLRLGKSELAAANWENPGGWRSMVISYDGRPRQIADRVLVGAGTMPMALRNRRRLAGRILAGLIEQSPRRPVNVLCLGAGPGRVVFDAMLQAGAPSRATLVDINPDAFEHGRMLARQAGLQDRVRFVVGDVRDIDKLLDEPPDVVKMLGICEHLSDEQVVGVAAAAAGVMPAGAPMIFNSLCETHGTDRFFRKVFGLHMNHRSLDGIQALMSRAGLGGFASISEPLGVYHIVVGRKTG